MRWIGLEEGVVAIREVADSLSQCFRAACLVVALCLAHQCVKFASRNVGLELTVPDRRIVLDEPLPKARKVLLREALHGPCDLGHGGHGNRLLRQSGVGNGEDWKLFKSKLPE